MEGHYKPTKADLETVARTFAEAFYDYPLHKYLLPDDATRKREHLRIGMVYAIFGYKFGNLVATSEDCEGVMLYASGKDVDPTGLQFVRSGALRLLLTRWGGTWAMRSFKVGKAIDTMRRKHAPDPHMYVTLLAVLPEHHGKGYARRLLAPLFKSADADRIPCYLETFKANNVTIYEHLGLELLEECPVAGTPLTLYSMLRRPPV
ncbi:MAG: GNAT family N-acetyltransferase [Candidatus Lokiarchaeota archaeon]|nr:GNAT family N-acetyltransferase [Candidatus Lokiarchaeota archaeon]